MVSAIGGPKQLLVCGVLIAVLGGLPAVLLAQTGSADPITDLLRLDGDTSTASGDFLEVDQAFVARAEVLANDNVAVHWDIADGYYLYRQHFDFALNGHTNAIASVALPVGEVKHDPYFGQVEVYHQRVAARIVLQRPLMVAMPLMLSVRYQGCAEIGLCYPPISKQFALSLPATFVVGAALAPADNGTFSETALSAPDRLTLLLRESSLLTIALSFFGFGLLLAFTPCVLPMAPILSSIIIGDGKRCSTTKAFGLSAVFVLAMALTYTAAGVVTATFGANLSAMLQTPLLLSMVAAVLGLLALSLFSGYSLSLPVAWREGLAALSNRQRGGTWLGVAVMGVLSALVIGPCISAPLVAALLIIGQSGDQVLGAIALFALGLGMGAPLLLLGTAAGRLLPRSGRWMVVIQNLFGVLLLALAIIILERIIPGQVVLLLWALLLIVTAIYMGALDAIASGASHWRRLAKGSGFVMLLYGAILIIGAASGANDPLQPLAQLNVIPASDKQLQFRTVKGIREMQMALQQAAVAGRLTMLKYDADWCSSCKQLERNTLADATVQQSLQAMTLLRADVTANDRHDRALLKHYALYGPPAILFFDANGKELRQHRVIGYMPAPSFLQIVHQVLNNKGTATVPPLKAAQIEL